MKSCYYCGRECEVQALHCRECGTPFQVLAADSTGTPPHGANPVRHSSLGRAITSLLGAILVPTGVGFAAIRALFDIFEFANGGPIGKPGVYGLGMIAVVFMLPPVALGTLIFALAICRSRCQTRTQGFACALAVVAVVLAVVSAPETWFLFPAVLLGKLSQSSIGWYIGAAIQIGLGAVLLGWMARLLGNFRYSRM